MSYHEDCPHCGMWVFCGDDDDCRQCSCESPCETCESCSECCKCGSLEDILVWESVDFGDRE